jgi:hypothetical protein
MKKFNLKLKRDEVHMLAGFIKGNLRGTELGRLKKEQHINYLLLSCLYELSNKLDAKQREIIAFDLSDKKPFSFTLRQHEALAFFFLTKQEPSEEAIIAQGSALFLVVNLIRTIRGEIHKQFLI